ncbi:MAG TPA: zinc finger domain-containing protein, partial [Thermodesulfobacteriota bacterium]|nr:zinc finger domain-containing protein [Thermodesulfobacteriota bacterium]
LIVSDLLVADSAPGEKDGAVVHRPDSKELSGLVVAVESAGGDKCERCWHYSSTVGADAAHPTICGRCTEALK